MVARPFRQAQRQIGMADILARPNVQKPLLLPNRLLVGSLNQTESINGGTGYFASRCRAKRGELFAYIMAFGMPVFQWSPPVFALVGERVQGFDCNCFLSSARYAR